jgi:hypothetical protein
MQHHTQRLYRIVFQFLNNILIRHAFKTVAVLNQDDWFRQFSQGYRLNLIL